MSTLNIAWITVKELIFERVFYILLGFAMLSMGLGFLMGQLTYAEQSKLTTDFLIATSQLSSVLFAIFMGISLFQREIISGSISMVLSKPVSRGSFLLGKYLGQVIVQSGILIVMFLITSVAMLAFDKMNYFALAQTYAMIGFECAVIAAITYCFSVMAGAITTAVVVGTFFLIGHGRTTVHRNGGSDSFGWQFISSLIPNLEAFDMKSLVSYQLSISWQEFGWAGLYALISVAFFLSIAVLVFNRRDILT